MLDEIYVFMPQQKSYKFSYSALNFIVDFDQEKEITSFEIIQVKLERKVLGNVHTIISTFQCFI